MDLKRSLQYFGLTDKEAKIYLTLLQIGKQSAYSVAKNSGLKKPTAYVLLEGLASKSVVNKSPLAKAVQYEAVDPVELFVDMRQRMQYAETALPELRALHGNKSSKTKTVYYEGLSGLREMYKQTLGGNEGHEQIAFYAHQKDTPSELKEFWKELNREYVKRGIKRRGITTLDPSLKDYLAYKVAPKEFLRLKSLSPKEYSSNISIEVFGNNTQIVSHRYLQGVLIENPDVANVMRQIFEIVWAHRSPNNLD